VAGGEAAICRLIDAFYDRVEADELLSPFFPGGVSHAGGSELVTSARLAQRSREL